MAQDAQLVEATRRGDVAAFGILVQQYQRMLVAGARHLTRNLDDAEDLAQEALVEAYRNLPSLREPDKFGAWLFAILHKKCLMHLRQRRPQEVELTEYAESLPANETADAADLVALLDDLPLVDREVLTAFYLHELSHAEVAEALGITVNAARVRCSRARERLRALITQHDAELRRVLQGAMGAMVPVGMLDGFSQRVMQDVATVTPVAVVAMAGKANLLAVFKAKWALSTAIFGVVLVAATGVLLARFTSKPVVEKKPAPPAIPAGWKRTLPSGATLEIVGVNFAMPKPKTWWRPDGIAYPQAPLEREDYFATNGPAGSQNPQQGRWFLSKYTNRKHLGDSPIINYAYNLPDDSGVRNYGLSQSSAGVYEAYLCIRVVNPASAMPKRLWWLPQRFQSPPPSPKPATFPQTLTLRIGVADGPWQTLWSLPHADLTRSNIHTVKTAGGSAIIRLQQVTNSLQEPQVKIEVDDTGFSSSANDTNELSLFDQCGKEINAGGSCQSSPNSDSQIFRYDNLELNKVNTITMRTRSFHWETFKDIAMYPKTPR